MFTHQFRRLMELLREQFGAAQNAINNQTNIAVDQHRDNRGQIENIAGSLGIIVRVLQSKDQKDDAAYDKTYGQQERAVALQRKLVFWAKWAFWAAFGYGAVAFWQGCMIRDQLRKMDATYGEMQKQTKAANCSALVARDAAQIAKESVDASRDQMELDERAWIAIKAINGPLGAPNVDFTNTGKTPAKNVTVYVANQWISNGSPSLEVKGKPTYLGTLSPGTDRSASINSQPPTMVTLYQWGTITYDDIFDRPHWITYCGHISPGASKWSFCHQHNETDKEKRVESIPLPSMAPCDAVSK